MTFIAGSLAMGVAPWLCARVRTIPATAGAVGPVEVGEAAAQRARPRQERRTPGADTQTLKKKDRILVQGIQPEGASPVSCLTHRQGDLVHDMDKARDHRTS